MLPHFLLELAQEQNSVFHKAAGKGRCKGTPVQASGTRCMKGRALACGEGARMLLARSSAAAKAGDVD